MPQVKYTGLKPKWFDNAKASGIVWSGNGDVQTVSDAQWDKLKAHSDVLEVVAEAVTSDGAVASGEKADGGIDAMTDAELHALAKERGYGLHHKLAGDNLRAKFAEKAAEAV